MASVGAVAILTHPTHRLPCNRLSGGDGETQCSKIDSGKAPDRSSLRSQAAMVPCGFTLAEAGITPSTPSPFPTLTPHFRLCYL